jgi:hypothetical protein
MSRFVTDVEAQVEAAMESSVPPVAERVVTELGYTLFQDDAEPYTEPHRFSPTSCNE